jgi:hypothetical protein
MDLTIESLEAAKATAFQQYREIATQLHQLYWDRLQQHLPEITAKLQDRYPLAVVQTERTKWTASDEFAFDHWVRIKFPSSLAFEQEEAAYQWIEQNLPLAKGDHGVTFAIV